MALSAPELGGRVAVVTGGASGIGRAIVRRAADAGARVVVADLNETGAAEVAAEVGGVSVAGDVSRPDDWDRIVEVARGLGGLDVAFLNAGVLTGEADIASLDEPTYRRVMGANVDGVVYGTRAAVREMRGRGGSIVATASLAGIVSFPIDPVYTMTKHAVVGLVRSLAPALAAQGIRMNAVCPAIVDTPLFPDTARTALSAAGITLIEPHEVAEAAVATAAGEGTGQCVVCVAGRPAEPHVFGPVEGLPFS
jgi:NAD(P)-dependent dehydrogenase (short-subunit alcohol dehydrogenase family)